MYTFNDFHLILSLSLGKIYIWLEICIVHVFLTFYVYHKLIDIMRVIVMLLRGLCLCIK